MPVVSRRSKVHGDKDKVQVKLDTKERDGGKSYQKRRGVGIDDVKKSQIEHSPKISTLRQSQVEHSPKLSTLRFFDLVSPSPSPFYTPQHNRPRSKPPNRHSLLNTIATPSRNSSILPERQKVSLEKAGKQTIYSSQSPTVNGVSTPKRIADKGKSGRLPAGTKSRQDVNVLINSLLSDDKDTRESGDDGTYNDDVIVIDSEEKRDKEADYDNIIGRGSPATSTLNKAAVIPKARPTPTVYVKFQLKSSEKKLTSATSVAELFNDDSSEDDEEPTHREHPLVRPTPKMITPTRKELVSCDPLIGVPPRVTRRGHVTEDPLVRGSSKPMRKEVSPLEKRKLRNDRMKIKGGGVTPRLIRNEESMTGDQLIGANSKEEECEEPVTKKRKLKSGRSKVQVTFEDGEVTPELIREDPLTGVTPRAIRREKTATEKRKLRRDHRSKEPTTLKDGGVTPRLIKVRETRKEEESVMEDPLAGISPKKRKLRSSQRMLPTDCGATPELIKETKTEEPVMEDPLTGVFPSVEKRTLRSGQSKMPRTSEATPRLINRTRRGEPATNDSLAQTSSELREDKPATEEKRKLRSTHRKPPTAFEDGEEEPTIDDPLAAELIVDLREEEPTMEKRKLRSTRWGPPTTIEDGGATPKLIKETRKEKTETEKRTLRRNMNTTTEKDNKRNVLRIANQMSSKQKNETASSSRITRNSRAQERTTEKESTTTETKRSTRRSTRTGMSRSTRTQSSENDKPYMHDSLDGLSGESDWNTSDDESSSEEEMEFEASNSKRTPLKPINAVRNKSRKRASPTPRSGADATKRLKLSLSSKRTGEAKKLKKVRTVEKKGTPSTTRRNGETAATPSRRKILTPHIPQRKKVAVGKTTSGSKANQFEAAKERLHVSALPETIPCRENEFLEICNYVEGKLHDETGGCMYISGVPGTGKTATVREVGHYLRQSCEEGDLPEFKFVEINGMRLTEPHRAYASILKQLTGEDATPDHASLLLDKYFSSTDDDKLPTVLLADELDLLWTRKQTVLYNLFDWPTRQHAKLIVLAVANTMDLPEKVMMNKVASRLGLTRLTFQPYTFQQLQEIVTSRMTGLKVFEPDAIQLAARKVAAVSGDARRALDIARRATEIAQLEKGVGLVGIPHIDRAVQEMFSSAKIQAIRHASIHEKMFLQAIIAEFRRSGLEEANFKGVHQQLDVIYKTEGMRPANLTELHGVCSQLGACRLLLVERGRVNIHTRIRLNISQDDVLFALRTR